MWRTWQSRHGHPAVVLLSQALYRPQSLSYYHQVNGKVGTRDLKIQELFVKVDAVTRRVGRVSQYR